MVESEHHMRGHCEVHGGMESREARSPQVTRYLYSHALIMPTDADAARAYILPVSGKAFTEVEDGLVERRTNRKCLGDKRGRGTVSETCAPNERRFESAS